MTWKARLRKGIQCLGSLVRLRKRRRWFYLDLIVAGVILSVTLALSCLHPSSAAAMHISTASQTTGAQPTRFLRRVGGPDAALAIPAPALVPKDARGACDPSRNASNGRQCLDANAARCSVDCNNPCRQIATVSFKQCIEGNVTQSTYQNPKHIPNPVGDNSVLIYFTPYSDTVDSGPVQSIWKNVLLIVDILVVAVLALEGARIILAGTVFRYADAVERLPGILLALISAHLSLAFITLILGLNNIVTGSLFSWADQNLQQSGATIATTQVYDQGQWDLLPLDQKIKCVPEQVGNLLQGINIQYTCPVQYDVQKDFQLVPDDLNFDNISSSLSNVSNFLNLALKIMGLMLLAQMLARLLFINLYIVLSPLGIACWALPGKVGQPITRIWLRGFVSTVMVQFIIVIAYGGTVLVVGEVMLFITSHTQGHLDTSTAIDIVRLACLWFIVRIPMLLATAAMRAISEVGGAMSQIVGTTVMIQFMRTQAIIGDFAAVAQIAVSGISILRRLPFFRAP